MATFIELLVIGILVGGVYGLLALGLNIVYKSTRVFNFAQGGLLIMAAYMFYLFLVQLHLPFWLSLVLLFITGFILGTLVDRLVLRPLIGQPILSAILITLALYTFFRGFTFLWWGGDVYAYPLFLPTEPWHLGFIKLAPHLVLSFLVAMVFFALFAVFFRFTKLGLAMRSTAEDHQVSQSLGINVKTIFSAAWVIAALVGATAAIFIGSNQGVNQCLDLWGLRVIPVAIVGGLDSIPGAIVAGLIIGVVEALMSGYLGVYSPGIGDVAPFVVLLLIILVKPYGLWGLVRIERI